jgi:hypothetical protein
MKFRGFFFRSLRKNRLIQNVQGGMINILGGHSIGHSKQISVCVLFRTIS